MTSRESLNYVYMVGLAAAFLMLMMTVDMPGNDEEAPKIKLCAVCHIRPVEVDGLCGPCYRWETK